MQVFATRKTPALGGVLNQLTSFFIKHRRAVKIMKLTAIILLGAFLQLSAKGISQNVTLSLKDAHLQKVFKEIERQTDYTFFYDWDRLVKAKKVTVVVSNLPINQVLDLCFKDQPFTYSISGKTITIGLKKEKIKVEDKPKLSLIDVKGRVVNENNDPQEGVSVTVKGTTIGTTTNHNGEFFLKSVDENAILIFSSVNIEAYEIRVGGKSYLDVALQTKITSMQEIVINKGYYTEKVKLTTGNVVTIKSKDIQNQPVNNPLLALVGRVPGVTIEQQTGFANSGVVVRIQGRNSINSGLDPLYVIDGIPYNSQPMPTIPPATQILGGTGVGGNSIGGNPLSLLNPNDIESIDILKDADATAIYGSRGANGVILITTKKGKAGQSKINANFRTGWGKVTRRLDLLNTDQYLTLRKEAYQNDGLPVPNLTSSPTSTNYDLTFWDQNHYTDWQDVLFGGTAKYTDGQISVSGGSTNTQFLVSAGYHKETTVFPGDLSYQKGMFQFNLNHSSANSKFKMHSTALYVIDDNQIPNNDLTSVAVKLAPNAPNLYNSDGTLNWAQLPNGTSTWINPLTYLHTKYSNKASNLIASYQLSYELFHSLKISSRFGYNNQQYDELQISPITAVRPELRSVSNRTATYNNPKSNGWIIEPQITYETGLGKGKFEALVGTSFQENTVKSRPVAGIGYSSDLLLENLTAAPIVIAFDAFYSRYKYNAIYGRLNYNFQDRYIINTTARRDGSSRFGAQNLFNNFYSVAGSWIFTNEKWLPLQNSVFSFGKLRISYGTSGNDQIGDYGFMNLYNPISADIAYQGVVAITPDKLTNQHLQWEETNKLQFGLDVGLFNDRIYFNLNYYSNRSSNLLTRNALSIVTGFTQIQENFKGVVENSGWELALNTVNLRSKNLNWSTSFNLTIPRHNGQLVSFPNLENTTYANNYIVGKSLYDSKVPHFLYVNPTTGIYQFSDIHGNATVTPQPVDNIGFANTSQRLFAGLQNNIVYKQFELDFSFQGVIRKAYIYSGERPGSFSGRGNKGNQPILVLNRWQKTGDVTNVQKLSAVYSNADIANGYGYHLSSDEQLRDASFIRLTNLSVSWQLPDKLKKSVHLQNARIFLQGQNLFTITKYKGLDPSIGDSPFGVSLPPLQILTIGVNVTF